MTGRNWGVLLQLAIFLPIQTLLHRHNSGGGSPPGGRATGAPGRKTGREAQRRRGAPCGAGRTGGAPCGDIQQGGEGKQCATQGLPGRILEPTSCLLAMKRHGPFSSPGHVCDHEPFFFHSLGSWDPPAWIPPTVTPCGYGWLWGPGSAVWQQPNTRCAPTPAWIPPTVTPCGYGRLWGPALPCGSNQTPGVHLPLPRYPQP